MYVFGANIRTVVGVVWFLRDVQQEILRVGMWMILEGKEDIGGGCRHKMSERMPLWETCLNDKRVGSRLWTSWAFCSLKRLLRTLQGCIGAIVVLEGNRA